MAQGHTSSRQGTETRFCPCSTILPVLTPSGEAELPPGDRGEMGLKGGSLWLCAELRGVCRALCGESLKGVIRSSAGAE